MIDAHDKARGAPTYFKAYEIPTPAGIPSTKFDLSDDDIQKLFDAGVGVGNTVRWEEYSRARRVIDFYDPRPHEALEMAVKNARQVYDRYAAPELWVEKLTRTIHVKFIIHEDWSTSYDRTYTFQVAGSKFLVFMRVAQTMSMPGEPQSIANLVSTVNEVMPDKSLRALPLVPAINTETKKGFLVVLDPPVDSSKSRTFNNRTDVPREFLDTIAKGRSDSFQLEITQLAEDDMMSVEIDVLAHATLPHLDAKADFAPTPVGAGAEIYEGKTYRRRTWKIGARPVGVNTTLRIDLDRAEAESGLQPSGLGVL